MSDTVIKVENLSKVYKLYNNSVDRLKEALHPLRKKYHHDFYALKDVSFEVKKGETVGIIGKNGSGKSTLLKVLTGVLTPSDGSYHVKGKISSLLELGSGFNPELSGLENVYFNGAVLGFTKEEIDKKLNEILAFADIGEFIGQPVKTYSSGMVVRLAFAVAVNVDPDVLIVDEALAVGDISFQKKCMERMDNFRESGKTIIFCSHDMHAIGQLCNWAIWVDEGEIKEKGTPSLAVSSYISMITGSGVKPDIVSEKSSKNPNYYVRNSSEVEILSVGLSDNNGKSKSTFITGEDINLEVKFKIFNEIDDPKYSIIILKENGIPVAINKSNYYSLLSQGKITGERVVRVRFPNIRFNTGKYILGFSVWDKSTAIQFATYRAVDFEIKSLNITCGPLEEKTVFFPDAEWETDSSSEKGVFKRICNVKYLEELELVFKKKKIDKKNVCIVGSAVMAILGFRSNKDIDLIVRSEDRVFLGAKNSAEKLSEHIELVGKGWGNCLGIYDEEIINNPKYYFEIDGFKFVKPEILYLFKKAGKREKDFTDIDLIEQRLINYEDWDFSLIDRFSRFVLTKEKNDKCGSDELSIVSLKDIVSRQYQDQQYGRLDIFVRYLAIESYIHKKNNGIELYNKMQKLRTGKESDFSVMQDLVKNFINNGYDFNSIVTIDGNYNLLDGSHRIALALFFKVDKIPVRIIHECSFRAYYAVDWFISHGFDSREIKLMENKRISLFREMGLFFYVFLWPPVGEFFDEIESNICNKYRVIKSDIYKFSNDSELKEFIVQMYSCDDIEAWKVEKKVKAMEGFERKVKVLQLELLDPKFRKKKMNNNEISIEVERLKSHYRQQYSPKLKLYFHDVIIHVTDNFDHNKKIHEILSENRWVERKQD